MTILSHPSLNQLADTVRGRVSLPSDPEFAQAHLPWNLAVQQPVCAVVEAADADDIARLVRFADSHELSVATQPSGHGATGRAAGAILLRTTRLDTIEIDPAAMTARIGAGVRSGDLQRAAAEHGLTALPGSSPVVSVTGAALGGGLSWFSRSFGWIADSLLGADVVTADGATARITPDTDSELLWALRGGGGDLAIVTALEVRLRSAPSVYGGRQLWPAAHTREVTRAYRAMTASAPDALTLWLEFLHFPGSDPVIAIDSTYLGTEQDARELMRATELLPAPLSDTRATMSVADLGTITAEPTSPGPGLSRAELLTHLDDATLGALHDEPIAPLMSLQVRHLQGALARPSDSPHGPLTEPYAVYLFGVPASESMAEEITRKQARLAAALPASGRKPVTFLNPTEKLSDALAPTTIERLGTLKKVLDPRQVIRGNFGVLE
ncbi:FAD-binding oxidoreductase [Ornithinimicrobium murale]|uniref:FAD-binding oxidoreductase n=1 Tax=Ornithinimicrobium murale TaxID=1050153 RepID=UPI000E0DC46D|nr:FAD-binding oxidoreductase [Ornithinimicrobium murale]